MKKLLLVLALLPAILAVAILEPLQVYADTATSDPYQGQYLLNADDGAHLGDSDWCKAQNKQLNWPDSLKTCNTGGGTVGDFDVNSSSYVMFRDLQPDPPSTITCNGQQVTMKTNRFTLFIAQAGKKINMYKDGYQYYFTSNGPITKGTVRAEPNSDPDYKCNWTGSYSVQQYETTGNGGTYDPNTINGGKGFVIGNDLFQAQRAAHNVNYASSWDMAQFTKNAVYGESGSDTCGTLDIGCWVGKIASGFTTGIKAIVGLFGDLLQWLFVPKTEDIKKQFDTTQTLMTDKLGFIAYPFEWISDFYQTFSSGSSWCNDSSCGKYVGNIFGSSFTIDFHKMQTISPTAWTFLTTALRGLAVATIIFTIRHKYLEMVKA